MCVSSLRFTRRGLVSRSRCQCCRPMVKLGHRPRPTVQHIAGSHRAEQLDQAGDGPRPARLVTGSQPGTVVTMEVLVEGDQVTPVRVSLELGRPSINRPASLLVPEKIPQRRSDSSCATSNSVISRPDPVGHSMRNSSP